MKRIAVIAGGLIAFALFALWLSGRRTWIDQITQDRQTVGIGQGNVFSFTVPTSPRQTRVYVYDLDSLDWHGAVWDRPSDTIEIKTLDMKWTD